MSEPTIERTDAQHEASLQREIMRELYVKANGALADTKLLLQHEDTPRHRQLEHELTVLVDGLEKDLGVKR